MGELGILNVGAGDTKLTFDPSKPAEVKRAAAAVTDMLRRGFAIFVEVGQDDRGPLYRRAQSFDPETCEYLIVGAPEEAMAISPAPRARGKRKATKRVPARETRAVAVARSAGG